MLQRLRLCRASDTVFRREIDSQRQWDYGTCYGDSFPAAKECTNIGTGSHLIAVESFNVVHLPRDTFVLRLSKEKIMPTQQGVISEGKAS